MKYQASNAGQTNREQPAHRNKIAEDSGSDDWDNRCGNNVRLAMDLLTSSQRQKLSSRKPAESECSTNLSSKKPVSSRSSTSTSTSTSTPSPNTPDNTQASDAEAKLDCPREIQAALQALAHQESINLSTQLDLLVRFDDVKGWRESGAKNCVAWATNFLHIERRTAWERLRVGRELRKLPLISRLFQVGRLSYSKVRLLTRIANAENEQLLAHASTDATVNDVRRICEEYRWASEDADLTDAYKSRMQWENRSLKWQTLSDGSVQIKLVLPPEHAQNYLHAIEHCENILYQERELEHLSAGADGIANHNTVKEDLAEACETSLPIETPSQRKADAAVLLAERSFAFAGEHVSSIDRYQVVLNIDNDSLTSSEVRSNNCGHENNEIPARKPMIEGIGAIPRATARRIACDCQITQLLSQDGEPLNIGRKHRVWPQSMRRAIVNRDRHCQFPGCTSHQFLQIHHIVHWADGGETSTDNGVCLCQFHHQLVHTEGYSIRRATINNTGFETTGLFSASKKRLLPTRCRFVFTRECSSSSSNSRPENEKMSARGRYSESGRNLDEGTNQEEKVENTVKETAAEYQLKNHRSKKNGDCKSFCVNAHDGYK